MFKLIKYELRGNLLTILGICITVTVANLLLLTRRSAWGLDLTSNLSVFLSIAAITIIFISSLNLMSKYLHTDAGYLLFTLPQSGSKIILSKLLTALIQITLVIIVTVLGICLTSITALDFKFLSYIKFSGVVYALVLYIWGNIYFLTFIYFCMVMGKVALRNKRLGKIGSFILFIVLALGLAWLESKLSGIFPQTINISYSSFFNNVSWQNSHISFIPINISKAVFDIFTFVALFKATAYMLDNKLDL